MQIDASSEAVITEPSVEPVPQPSTEPSVDPMATDDYEDFLDNLLAKDDPVYERFGGREYVLKVNLVGGENVSLEAYCE